MLNSVIRAIASSPLTQELSQKLSQNKRLNLQGASRLPKGLVTSALAQQENDNLLVVCSTLEEAARWMANIELMGWKQTFFSILPQKQVLTRLLIQNQRWFGDSCRPFLV